MGLACPAWAQEGENQGSLLLIFILLPIIARRKSERRYRSEKGERQSGYSTVGAHSVRPFLYLFAVLAYPTATHTGYSPQARHNCAAQLFCALLRTAPPNYTLSTNFTVGCDDLGAPHLTISIPANKADTLVRPYEVCSLAVHLFLSLP